MLELLQQINRLFSNTRNLISRIRGNPNNVIYIGENNAGVRTYVSEPVVNKQLIIFNDDDLREAQKTNNSIVDIRNNTLWRYTNNGYSSSVLPMTYFKTNRYYLSTIKPALYVCGSPGIINQILPTFSNFSGPINTSDSRYSIGIPKISFGGIDYSVESAEWGSNLSDGEWNSGLGKPDNGRWFMIRTVGNSSNVPLKYKILINEITMTYSHVYTSNGRTIAFYRGDVPLPTSGNIRVSM